MKDQYAIGVAIDLCSRKFLFIGDLGQIKPLYCKTPKQFIDVWNLVNDNLNPYQIEYTQPTIAEK